MALIIEKSPPEVYYICDQCGKKIEAEFYRIEEKHYCKECVYVDDAHQALEVLYS